MSSPEKKEPEPLMLMQSTPDPPLPDDLLLSCFARVSRLYYPTLSLVSKRFRSLLASPELYKARSLLGNTESCLYVCVDFYPRSRWYTLCLKPNQTLTNGISDEKKERKSSGYVLATVPRSPRAHFRGLVAVGSNIYIIKERSSIVSILDCRTHTWCKAPSLPVKLLSLSASVLDEKIYVAGGDGSDSKKNTLEVFDTKTQTWDVKTIPCSETESLCYYPSRTDYNCVIENVLYSAYDGVLRWYDSEVSKWIRLMGLEEPPKFSSFACIRLADYGGKLAVFGEVDLFDLSHGGSYKKIWCAEIALERRKSHEIWGKVEWFDEVLTVPKLCNLVKVLSVTI